MTQMKGVVLILALVFLLVMTLLVTASLLISQLSHKAALSGQQQLQISQQALQQHFTQATALADDNAEPTEVMADCPAQYAGWSAGALRCEVFYLSTDTYSDNRQFYAGYSSIILKQHLAVQDN
ncbi:hypothetical protein [Rheinheimera sp.]|jgi:Tfp pilus assembly protein PilV|uniref:hypothetical protein n=1 Tax=Rheinheimera sp. TaxID=1869214 RepID=UPI0037CC54FB|tara:strand:+ start:5681 stop:6052 length:372 start_codon:yes stop_codon:yes gene_type:complete